MLEKSSYKLLCKHSWLNIERTHTNPSQLKSRWKKRSKDALSHLDLLAQKMPEKEFVYEVFRRETLGPLIKSLLDTREDPPIRKKLDYERADLATGLVEISIDFCISQLEILYKDTPSLIEPIISNLRQTIANCKDLTYKLNIIELENTVDDRDLVFLFDWNKIPGRDEKRIIDFLSVQRPDAPIFKIYDVVKKSPFQGLSFDIEQVDGIFHVEVDIQEKGTKAILSVFDNDRLISNIPLNIKTGENYKPLFYFRKR
jgi:hypothetical protein